MAADWKHKYEAALCSGAGYLKTIDALHGLLCSAILTILRDQVAS